MKRILTLAALCLTISAAAAQKDTLRILAIGNSFSQDAVEQNLHEIALSYGQEMIIGNMYIGGCSLERHWGNIQPGSKGARDYQYRKVGTDGVRHNTKGVTVEEALADEKWDVVSFQQCSPLSGVKESNEPFLGELVAFVRARSKADVKLVWHQTWAYAVGSVHPSFPDYECDQKKMYGMIMDSSRDVCERYGFTVIPCGSAIQTLRKTYSGENCTRDGFHLNNGVGRYTAALTWFEALTGTNVEGCAYKPETVSGRLAETAQKCVHSAILEPYRITDLGISKLPVNYDEEKIPAYTLPDALTLDNGKKVKNARQWMKKRRPELLESFREEMFGHAPEAREMDWEELYRDGNALGGLATRREVRGYFDKEHKKYMTMLIYTPNGVEGKVPAFVGINFYGNHTVTAEEGILLPDAAKTKSYGINAPHNRGGSISSWQVETLMKRGYGLVTWYRGDVDPDFDDADHLGIQPLFFEKGQAHPRDNEWGTIGAWAWSISRAVDYLEGDDLIDAGRIASIGHSRLAKTSLWAGVQDERIAMVISNDSGCGGAAISRRAVGETVESITLRFPHWFCRNFQKYMNNESALPFDQHELIALAAPRPVYIASAKEDRWADPKGEKIAMEEAKKVYELFGKDAVSRVGYHIREGKHAITAIDWAHYLDFADKYLK